MFQSPYNTYQNKGLPPGPICTPQPETIDIVLNAPQTDYLYFVAKSDFSGTHIYSSNYDDHRNLAKEFARGAGPAGFDQKSKPLRLNAFSYPDKAEIHHIYSGKISYPKKQKYHPPGF